jgi:hypothetical protein
MHVHQQYRLRMDGFLDLVPPQGPAYSSCFSGTRSYDHLQVIIIRTFHPESSAPSHSDEENYLTIADPSPYFALLRYYSWQPVFKLSDCRVHATELLAAWHEELCPGLKWVE